MSGVDEGVRREAERGSSVKLFQTAKGDTRVEVKRYTDEEPGALEAASVEAQRVYDALVQRYAT